MDHFSSFSFLETTGSAPVRSYLWKFDKKSKLLGVIQPKPYKPWLNRLSDTGESELPGVDDNGELIFKI